MLRRPSVLSALVSLLVVALAMPGLALAGGPKPIERPIGSVVITGELEERVFLTFEQFEALPLTSRNVSVMFQAGSAMEQHTFTGFLLFDVLNLLKPQFDPDVKNDRLRFYVSATATDDYQAIVAWASSIRGSRTSPSFSRSLRTASRGQPGAAPRGSRRHPRRPLRLARRDHPPRSRPATRLSPTQLLVALSPPAEVLTGLRSRERRERGSPLAVRSHPRRAVESPG